jgi:hypothetical protein
MTPGITKYKRVAQRLREKFKNEEFLLQELEDAIFIECGTDPRTIKAALERMQRLKLIEKVETEREFGKPYVDKYKLPHSNNEYF